MLALVAALTLIATKDVTQLRWIALLLVAALLASPAVSGPLLERPLRALVRATLGLFGVADPGVAP